jgi:regulator of RNase E activity RraA
MSLATLKGGKFKMIKHDNFEPIEPEENITLADIVETEEDKKILEPVVEKPVENKPLYIVGKAIPVNLYVRKEPDTRSDIILFMKKGDTAVIDVNGSTKDYYMITANSVIGYVPKDQLNII